MELHEIGKRAKAASRHLAILSTSKKNEALKAVAAALVSNSADIIAANEIDVKNAYENLGEIIGETVSDDIIDEVFARFCLGK